MYMWESKSVGQTRVCLFAERLESPQPGAWAQDWHTSQVSVVLFPSSLGVLYLIPIITMPLWKKATVVRNRNIQCLEPPRSCLLLTTQEGEGNGVAESPRVAYPKPSFSGQLGDQFFLTDSVRGAWLCRAQSLLGGACPPKPGLATVLGMLLANVGLSWMTDTSSKLGAGVSNVILATNSSFPFSFIYCSFLLAPTICYLCNTFWCSECNL